MNETLLVLKLNGNKICNKGALAIAGALQVNTILQELDMADTDMVGDACDTGGGGGLRATLCEGNSMQVRDFSRQKNDRPVW